MGDRADERLLRGVPRLGGVPEQSADESEDRPVISPREPGSIPRSDQIEISLFRHKLHEGYYVQPPGSFPNCCTGSRVRSTTLGHAPTMTWVMRPRMTTSVALRARLAVQQLQRLFG